MFPHVSAAIQLSNEAPSKGDTIKYIYTDSQHKNPLCRVVPLENKHRNNTEEAFSYDMEKYREMILDAAETVLGYFGFDRTVYGNKKNTGPRKWRWLQAETRKRKGYHNGDYLTQRLIVTFVTISLASMKLEVEQLELSTIVASLALAIVLGISSLYLYSTTSIALGASSLSPMPSSSTTASNTNDTTLNEFSVLNAKGVSLNGLGKYNESITYFDKVLAIDPNNVLALNEKGNALGYS